VLKQWFVVLVIALFCCLGCSEDPPSASPRTPGGGLEDAPKIVATIPPLNSTGPYAAWDTGSASEHVLVRFNRQMNAASVARSLTLESSVRPLGIDSTLISTTDQVNFSLNLLPVFQDKHPGLGEVLTLSLRRSVSDVYGLVIWAGTVGTFLPEPSFRVRAMTPPSGSALEPSVFVIRLLFNSPIDGTILPHVHLAPLPGPGWVLSDDSLMLTTTMEILAPEQHLYVDVDADARDAKGNQIGLPFAGTITAIPFQITPTKPRDTVNLPLYTQFGFFTQYAVPLESFTRAFHITPEVAGGMQFAGSGGVFDAVPGVELKPGTSYVIRIDTSLQTAWGSHLGSEATFSFRTAPLRMISATPGNSATGVPRTVVITGMFNAYLDSTTVGPAIHVEPPTAGSIMDTYRNGFAFNPYSALLPNTLYTVTVDTTLRTIGGARLAAPLTYTFTTGEN
jgi:hypothetical protein